MIFRNSLNTYRLKTPVNCQRRIIRFKVHGFLDKLKIILLFYSAGHFFFIETVTHATAVSLCARSDVAQRRVPNGRRLFSLLAYSSNSLTFECVRIVFRDVYTPVRLRRGNNKRYVRCLREVKIKFKIDADLSHSVRSYDYFVITTCVDVLQGLTTTTLKIKLAPGLTSHCFLQCSRVSCRTKRGWFFKENRIHRLEVRMLREYFRKTLLYSVLLM